MSANQADQDGVRVGGFLVTRFISMPGKKDDEAGKIQITLEAKKDEINTGSHDLGDIIKFLNIHQEGRHPLVLRVLPETNS